MDEDAHLYQGIYTLENHSTLEEPPLNGRWVDLRELAALTLSSEEQRVLIVRYLEEARSRTMPQNRRVWHQPGWYAGAHKWIESTLTANGYELTGPIEQFDSWGLTCLMTVETNRGTIYFKTAPDLPLFAHEPSVMQGLATLFPQQIPMPVAIEPIHRWMLLDDFGPAFYERPTEEVDAAQPGIVCTFGELQRRASPHIEQLLEIGCLDRRLIHLPVHAEELFADERIMGCLAEEEVRQLRARLPLVEELSEQLGKFNIPETLIHGDLGMGNVARTAEEPLFFDWTEASIGHPFFDIFDMFFAEDPSKQTRVRNSYLSAWAGCESWERLLDAWRIARPLCALYHAISYRNICTNLESPFQEAMLHFVRRWLRRILEYTEEL